MEEMGPNEAAQKEKAEGSRENVNLDTDANRETDADNPMERGSGQESHPERPLRSTGGAHDDAGGISNRPLSEEERLEHELPPRGQAKGGSHAS